ncbi:MAG: YggU family protein [Acidobacteria bacterium]|nr:YggU family protein [Acidobacteriota bacterium]
MITATPDGVMIDVRVIPRASKSCIAGTRDDALVVRLTAPPVEGAANEALVEVLAKTLGVPKRAVTIASGEHTRHKRVRVAGIDAETARARLIGRAGCRAG